MKPETLNKYRELVEAEGIDIRTNGQHLEAFAVCRRCFGSGEYSYNHLDGTMCYGCRGGRGRWIGLDAMAKRIMAREARQRSKQRAKEAEAAEAAKRVADIYKAHPALLEAFEALSENEFVQSIRASIERTGYASDNQIGTVLKNWTEARAPKAEVPDTDQRLTLTATLQSTKRVDTRFGSVDKGLFVVATENGDFKLWGTVPQAVSDAKWDYQKATGEWPSEVGATVTFTARVERSRDDKAFGFFKRPTKVSVEFAA